MQAVAGRRSLNKGKTPAARRREAVPPTRGAKCRYAACAKLSIPPLSLWRLAKRSQDCSLPHMTACWCISNQTTLIVFDTSESSADLWGSPMDRVHKKQDSLSRAPNAELGIGCVCVYVCARAYTFLFPLQFAHRAKKKREALYCPANNDDSQRPQFQLLSPPELKGSSRYTPR